MRWLRLTGILLCTVCLVGLFFSLIPPPRQAIEIPFTTENGLTGSLQLSLPSWVPTGVKEQIQLLIHFEAQTADVSLPGSLKLVSHLEMSGVNVSPPGSGSVVIDPHQSIKLLWVVNSLRRGVYPGRIWLFAENGAVDSTLILSREISLQARDLIGISFPAVRTITIAGGILGGFLVVLPLLKRNVRRSS